MSWFSNFMNPGRAYEGAGAKEQQGYDTAQGYYKPYTEHGETAGNSLQEMMDKMMHPEKLQDEWSKNYNTSEYAKQMQSEAQSGGMDAASAMGLGGSNTALSNIQKGSADIMQKDRQNYMNDMMQKYMGAMGIGQGMYNTGAGVAGQAGGSAQQHGEWQGQNTFNQQSAGTSQFKQMYQQALAAAAAAMGGKTGGAAPWINPG